MRRHAPWLTGLLLAGCVSIPEPAKQGSGDDAGPGDDAGSTAECVDTDNDGYPDFECNSRAPVDCAIDEPAIHPGALDPCGDEIDDDCVDGPLACSEAIVPNDPQDLGNDGLEAGLQQVSNGELVITFDGGAGFMPTSLQRVREDSVSTNLLFAGPMDEKYIGTHIFGHAFSWRDSIVSPDVLADGPAATIYEVSWSDDANNGTSLSGTTQFAIYPDGRIHRHEELTPTGSGGTFFTSYVALDPAQFTNRVDPTGQDHPLVGSDALVAEADPPFHLDEAYRGEVNELPTGSLCAYNDADSTLLSMAWRLASDFTGPAGLRLPESVFDGMTQNHQFALNYDWERDARDQASYEGSFQLALGVAAAGDNACTGNSGLIAAYLEPKTIAQHEGEPDFIDPLFPGDDDGDGYNEELGFYQIDGHEDYQIVFDLEGSGSTGPTSVYRIANLPNTDRDPWIILNENVTILSHGRDYLLQREGKVMWLFLRHTGQDPETVRIEFP